MSGSENVSKKMKKKIHKTQTLYARALKWIIQHKLPFHDLPDQRREEIIDSIELKIDNHDAMLRKGKRNMSKPKGSRKLKKILGRQNNFAPTMMRGVR